MYIEVNSHFTLSSAHLTICHWLDIWIYILTIFALNAQESLSPKHIVLFNLAVLRSGLCEIGHGLSSMSSLSTAFESMDWHIHFDVFCYDGRE